eukprot:NODE_1054_length_2418_cov_0.962053.p1 type:complete len:328 gc:universal NODE_1054_length_2418_cov_0.962053:454-1437(+)
MEMEFVGKKILAPMVRFSSLPIRLLAIDYDFDIIYGPEIIAQRIIDNERTVRKDGIIEYSKNGNVNFRTSPLESNKFVFQLGCSKPELAIKAAQTLKQDIKVIDLNCGCPKPFSLKGKMGAALLEDPDLLCDILRALKSEIGQVTCKIRVFNDLDQTLELIHKIKQTGISALAVHVRTKNCRPHNPAKWDYFKPIKQNMGDIPLIANGDILNEQDATKLKELGCDSFMVARGAMKNMTIFRRKGVLSPELICKDYLHKCILLNNNYQNTKWTLLNMYPYTTSDLYRKWTRSKSLQELCNPMQIMCPDVISDPKYDVEFPYVPNQNHS